MSCIESMSMDRTDIERDVTKGSNQQSNKESGMQHYQIFSISGKVYLVFSDIL